MKLNMALTLLVVLSILLTSINAAEKRQPGTLLLNMLTKNEAEHLDRTLPEWAKIIDAWIIGIDEENSDNSPEIIKKHLGHLPGEIVVVHFDGIGPTWNILMQHGIKKYPQITHGIIADADFRPMQDKLNKMELDVRCSKLMFTIYTEDKLNHRLLDWIYRNIEGATVSRRTHQMINVPKIPGQPVFQKLIKLNVDEQTGGYQDRTGKKFYNYIKWLEIDLKEFPNDGRTLYYLGHAHWDIFLLNKDNPTDEHWNHLHKSVERFIERTNINDGGEEVWFAALKLGEIYERFYKDLKLAVKYYSLCAKNDPERADPVFYIGQLYRLYSQHAKAIPWLVKASKMPMPNRSVFQWHSVYNCLAELELGRAATMIDAEELTKKEYQTIIKLVKRADCRGQTPDVIPELAIIMKNLQNRMEEAGDTKVVKPEPELPKPAKVATKSNPTTDSETETSTETISTEKPSTSTGTIGAQIKTVLDELLSMIDSNLENLEKVPEVITNLKDFSHKFREFLNSDNKENCRKYRVATTPYLKYVDAEEGKLKENLDDEVQWDAWKAVNQRALSLCR